jgi:hypothetical protein
MCSEPIELWMVQIPPRITAQYFAREKRLPPEGYEALGIEIAGMKRPDA